MIIHTRTPKARLTVSWNEAGKYEGGGHRIKPLYCPPTPVSERKAKLVKRGTETPKETPTNPKSHDTSFQNWIDAVVAKQRKAQGGR